MLYNGIFFANAVPRTVDFILLIESRQIAATHIHTDLKYSDPDKAKETRY